MTKNIFIIENTSLGENLPLSIYLTNLIQHLPNDSSLELNLIVSDSPGLPKDIEERFKNIYQLNASLYSALGNLRFAWQAFRQLQAKDSSANVDVLHCLYPNSSLIAASLFRLLVNSHARILYDVRSPWIEMIFAMKHLPQMLAWLVRPLLVVMEWLLAFFVDHTVFISQGLADYYRAVGLSRGRTPYTVIPTAVDLTRFAPQNLTKKPHNRKPIQIGYIGTISRSRQIERFLPLFKELNQQLPVQLQLIGQGDAVPDIQRWVVKNGLQDCVKMSALVPHEEIPALINSFDFGLSHLAQTPVYDYSFPLKILEYLACGIPVLASKTPAHLEISRQLEGIYIYESWTDLLKIMKEDVPPISPDLTKFSFEQTAARYAGLYAAL